MAETETPPEPPAPSPSLRRSIMQRIKIRALKTFALVVLGGVALVLAVVFGIDTGPGHRFVADQIAGIRFENGMRIVVGRIEGSLYGRMTIHDLSVRDIRGEFLFSPEIEVDWRPFAWLDDHVDVRSATARRMTLRRVPEFRKTPPSDAPLLPDVDIDVGRLRIDRFVTEPAVSGERRVMALAGRAHIADGRAQVRADGATVAVAGSEGGDRFALVLDAVPSRNRLDIDLDMLAPQGGIIASMAGLRDPLALKVSGRGDWARWDGTLAADVGKGELARLDLTARDGTFAIKGPTRIARLFEGPTASLLGPTTRIDIAARLAQRRATLSGSIASPSFRLTPAGEIDLGENRFDGLDLSFVLLRPTALAENLSGAGMTAGVVLDGAFRTPTVSYRIRAARVSVNGVGLEGLAAQGRSRTDTDHFVIPVDATARRITGLDTVAGGTLAAVRLTGDLAVQWPRVLSDNLRMRSGRVDAGVVLAADLSKGLYTGAIDGRIDNYRLAGVGQFAIRTDMDLKHGPGGFSLAGTIHARSTSLANASLRSYLGGNLAASSRVVYGPDGVVRFSGLRMNAPDLRITGGSGSWAPGGRIALAATGTSWRYGDVGLRITGTVDRPDAHVTAEHPGLGLGLANLDARISRAGEGYRLDLTADTDYGPLSADVTLATGARTALAINRADLSGVRFAGNLVQTPAGPFAGNLTADGNGIGGSLELAAEGRYQVVDFHLRARDAVFQGPAQLAIGSAIVDGRAVLYDQPSVIADAQLAGTHFGAFDLAAGRVLVDYRNGRGKAKALVEGVSGVPFRVGLNADLAPDLWRVALQGRVRGQNLATRNPARIIPRADGYELLPTAIAFGGGTARIAGRYGPGIAVQSRLEGVDLAIVNAFLPGYGIGGSASGSLDFSQERPGAMPRADARLSFSDFTRTSATTVSQPVDVSMVARLLPDGGEARAVIRRRGAVIGRMAGTLRPLPPGEGSWTARLLEAPLGGGIRYNGPADTLFSFVGLGGQSVTGPVGLAADFSCRITDPCLNGVIRGKDITYENQAFGTRLTSVNLAGRFSGNALELESFSARAGAGTVTASGRLSLAAAAGYPMDLAVTLDRARLARSEALSATATGSLRLTKAAGETALLSGDLRLPETRYQIVREGAAQVPRLSGVRIRPARGTQRVSGDEPAPTMTTVFGLIRLDLRLRAPDQLFVSGMGLESEWGANFTLTGTSAVPVLTGKIELVRGTLGFAGHSFEMENGSIVFTGGKTIDPTVAMTATDTIEDVDVSVNVTGRALNPQVDFTSTPALPDDEVLSRILFGSSIANLSAIQAVQLAGSLNSLRATGGGLNPLGKLKSAAGIDRLRILAPDQTTGRGTAVAAGQYLTDDIYVELITDARGFTATQLEVSVTRWLSVLSQAGGSGVNSVNVRIKKDY